LKGFKSADINKVYIVIKIARQFLYKLIRLEIDGHVKVLLIMHHS